MKTINVNLTKAQDEFIRQLVDDGEFQNASEAIRTALRDLQHHSEKQERELSPVHGADKRVAGGACIESDPERDPVGFRESYPDSFGNLDEGAPKQ